MRITITLAFILVSISGTFSKTSAQSVEGQWKGTLEVFSNKLRLVFHIKKENEGYVAKMDSPDQGALGLPVSSVTFQQNILKLEMTNIGASYEGTWKADTLIEGKFSQMGQSFPLRLVLSKDTVTQRLRPQEPKQPYPYRTEEVVVENKKANVQLAGTLSLPAQGGPFPAAILISGSGPQNRDEEIFGHKPFLVIADFLTRQGMAVLRYDDRGVGTSTGNFNTATTYDLATDATSAFEYLQKRKDINPGKIGLIGHSEGGMIAPMVATFDPEVAYLILLAAPGIPIDSLLHLQNRAIAAASGMPGHQIESAIQINRRAFELIKSNADTLEQKLSAILSEAYASAIAGGTMSQEQADKLIQQQIAQLNSPWMRYFIQFAPREYLTKVKSPVLALNGKKDLQVTSRENLDGIRRAFDSAGNTQVTVKELENLNHLFQHSETGIPAEYATNTETFSNDALNEILEWLRKIKIL